MATTGLIASVGLTLGGLAPSSPASAIDIIEFVSVNGVFANPVGEDGNTPPCLQYRAGGVNVGQGGQSSDPTTLNEIRFGDGEGDGCGSVDSRSGFGFEGVSTAGTYSSLFELGRFTHFNNPIAANDNNVGTTDLEASFTFRDLTDGSTITLNPTYQITLDETPNDADPCAYPAGPNGNGCADRIVIDQPAPVTVDVGETTFTIDVGGFGTIDENTDLCDLSTVIEGNSVLTPEGGASEFCVYGTASQATLVIDKTSLGGDGTFDFSYQEYSQLPGQVGTPIAGSQVTTSVTTVGGSGTSGALTIEPGIYTLDEINVPAGVRAGELTCAADDPADTFVTIDGVEYLDIDSDETITCSITNTRDATITVVKDASPNGAQDFAFTTTGAGLPGAFSLDDDADGTLSNTATFSVEPGDYTIAESATPGWQLDGLVCDVDDFGDGDVATQAVDGATASLHVGPGDAVTCTYTNEALARLVLAKEWLVAQEGDSATVTADVDGDGSADETLVSIAGATMPQTDVDPTPLTFVLGSDIVLAESVLPPENYESSLACIDDVGGAALGSLTGVGTDGRSGTQATNADQSAAGATITCTFTNPRRDVTVTVVKDLVPATDSGQFTLTADGFAGAPAQVTGGDGATTSFTANVGDTISVSETAGNGATDLGVYTSSVRCVGPGVDVSGDLSTQFVVPFAAADDEITCTFTNVRDSASLTVAKAWQDAVVGDAVSIASTGGVDSDVVDFDSTADVPTEIDTDATVYTVYAGETLTLSEQFDVGVPAQYASSLDCVGATDDDPADGITIDSADEEITCTFTNARRTGTFTLDKAWGDADALEQVELTATGDDAELGGTIDTTATAPDGAVGSNSFTTYAGETVSFAETFTTAANAANYTTSVACVDGAGSPVGFDADTDGRGGSLAVGDDPVDVTCTFTNTLKQSGVVVQKVWADGAKAGDTALLNVSVRGGVASDTDSSTAPAAPVVNPADEDADNVVAVPAFAGDVVDFDEDLGAATANYDVAWSCDDQAQTSGSGDVGSVTVTAADADAGEPITCTITNTRRSVSVTLVKDWGSSPIDSAGVALSMSGGDGTPIDGVDTNDGDDANDTAATVLGYSGETLSLSESFLAGDPANYATSLSCTGGDLTYVGGALTASLDVLPTDTDPIVCTFVNERRSAELILSKAWQGAYDDDTVELEITAPTGSAAGGSTAPASTVSASLTVYAGDDVTLAETFTVGTAATYSTELVCDVAGPLGTTVVGETISGVYEVASTPVADTCRFVNAGLPEVSVDKAFVSAADPDTDGVYDVRYVVTVANAGPGASTYDLSDSPDFDSDLVIDAGSAVVVGRTATIADWAGAPWQLATGATIAGSTDATTPISHVYTLDFVVDANAVIDGPGEYDPCDPQDPAGTGLFNVATLTVDGEEIDADDCGDIDPPDLDISKTFVSVDGPDADGRYVVVYDVSVDNVGTVATQYALVDEPAFSVGLGIVDGSAVGPATPADYAGNPWVLAGDPATPAGDDQPIAAGDTHVYTLTFVVDGSALIDETEVLVPCSDDASAGEGLFNSATLTYAGERLDDDDCGDPDVPVVSIDKTFVSATDADADGRYDVTYDVVVANGSAFDTSYDLSDTPSFDADLAIVGVPTAVGTDGTNPIVVGAHASPTWDLVTGQALAAGATHTYTLSFVVDATSLIEPTGDPLPSLDPCSDDPVEGEGLFNAATLTYAGLEKHADDCGDPKLPDLDISKVVTSVTGPDADGRYAVDYTVAVSNGGDGATAYDLVDAPVFTPGVAIVEASAAASGGPADPADYAGSPWELAADQPIGPGDTHEFALSFVVDGSSLLDGSVALVPCGDDPQEGQGFFNEATLTYAGSTLDDDDCDDPDVPVVTIDKTFAAADDADADGVYDVTYSVVVENTSAFATTYSLVDVPEFDDDLVIVSGSATVSGGPADPAPHVVGDPWTLASGEAIAGGATHTYSLSFVVDATALIEPSGDPLPALTECDVDDPAAGEALFNGATLTYAGQTKQADDCGEPQLPDLSIDKSAVTLVGPNAAGRYTVTYDIVVENTGDGATVYDLVDTPAFDDDLVIDGTPTADAVAVPSTTITPGAYTPGDWTLVDDQPIAAGAVHTYTLTFVVDGSAVIGTPAALTPCGQTPAAGEALFNGATLTYADAELDDADCVTPGVPTISVDKVARDGQPVLVTGSTYDVTFDVTVSNVSNVDGAYTLTDVPAFGDGADVDNITVTGEGVAISDYTAGAPIVIDRPLPAGDDDTFVVTVRFTVAADMAVAERSCTVERGVEGQGTYNSATVVFNEGGTDQSNDCVDIPEPDVSIDKVVDGEPTRDPATGVWTIDYLVTVTSSSTGGPAVYDVYDEFRFGAGVTIVDGTASAVNTVPGDIDTQGDEPTDDFDGVGNTAVVQFQPIEPGAVHVYAISVDATVAVGPDTDGDCIREPGEGSGFLNAATLNALGGEPETTEACAGFAQLTLVKELVNDDGGNATLADFPLTAAGPVTLSGVSGTQAVSSAVPAGSYDLSEETIAGYTASEWLCVGAAADGSSVALADGADVTCTIVNDDQPVDLELTKDDGGFTAIAGGDPIPYTITVRNIGERDVDLGEAVTVTDTLPTGLSWNSFPANCSASGATLTCDIDPALLPAGGAAVVIDTLVDTAPDLASGEVENQASVTTQDDPVCDGDDCSPPPCPATANNNVDCDQTPIERFASIFITKTDDVADGAFVQPGESFSYELVTGNLGPSTVLADLVIDDELPAQLRLDSIVASSDWTCNDVSPIECTWNGGPVFPGDTLPAITVNVIVNDDAVGPTIDNTAVVTALVDVLPENGDAALAESHFGGVGDIVTAEDSESTPMEALADLAIVKTASVGQIGAGGGFEWILDVTNNGPGTAIGVVIGDLVPDEVTVTGVASADFDCTNDGNDVVCTVTSLAVGDSGRVRITVEVPAGAADGTVVNVGTVESETPDPDLTNNSDDAEVVIVAQAPPTTLAPAPVTLPRTGSDATHDIMSMAMTFLLLGGFVVLVTRRRRPQVA